MPNIRERQDTALDIRPTEVGIDATAAAARRIGAFYNQTAGALESTGHRAGSAIQAAGDVVVKQMDHEQIAAGSAKGAELFAGLVEGKDNLIKGIDPNDPLYGQKVEGALKQWREETLEPTLEKFSSGFTTENSQRWAQHFVDQTREHMFHQTAADTSTAAGIGVKNSIRTTVNVATNTALQHPETADQQLSLVKHSITGLVGSSPLKGTVAAQVQTEVLEKAREQIIKAKAIGAIRKSDDPERTAQELIAKYPQYISGAEAIQLANEAKRQQRAARVDQAYADHMAKVEKQDVSDKAEEGYLKKLFSDNPNERSSVTTKAIANDDRLTRQAKEHFINIVEREMKPMKNEAVSRSNWLNFSREISGASDDDRGKMKNKIDTAYGQGQLTRADWNDLRKDIEQTGTPEYSALARDRKETFAKFERSIDIAKSPRGEAMPSALGQQNMARAWADAKALEKQLGPEKARDLYRYDSPNFFFKAENLRKYQSSMKDINDYDAALRSGKPIGSPTTAAPPRESDKPANFNERYNFDAGATVKTKADFDALKPGTEFTGEDGKRYRKPPTPGPRSDVETSNSVASVIGKILNYINPIGTAQAKDLGRNEGEDFDTWQKRITPARDEILRRMKEFLPNKEPLNWTQQDINKFRAKNKKFLEEN